MLKTALANVVAGKIAAATATAAAMGGVSLAAATGHLPGPLQDVAHSAFGAPAASGRGAPGQSSGSAQRGAAEASESAPAPQESDASSAPESDETTASAPSTTAPSLHPSLTGLCTAYQAHEARQAHGHANPNADKYLNSHAFSVLVTAAGGTDGVQDYCTALIGPAPTRPSHPVSSDHPSRPTHTTPSHPSSTDHPSRPTHTSPSHPSSSDHPSRPTHTSPSHPSSTDHPSRPTHTTPSHPSSSDHPSRRNSSHPARPAHGGGSSHAHGRP